MKYIKKFNEGNQSEIDIKDIFQSTIDLCDSIAKVHYPSNSSLMIEFLYFTDEYKTLAELKTCKERMQLKLEVIDNVEHNIEKCEMDGYQVDFTLQNSTLILVVSKNLSELSDIMTITPDHEVIYVNRRGLSNYFSEKYRINLEDVKVEYYSDSESNSCEMEIVLDSNIDITKFRNDIDKALGSLSHDYQLFYGSEDNRRISVVLEFCKFELV